MGFFTSFFSGKKEKPENEKTNQKNFEIFKYDGMRAQRMGRLDYAIKCFTEALKLDEDFETMGYLAQVYIQTNQLEEAKKVLVDMTHKEKDHINTYLTLANVCFMLEDYPDMAEAAQHAIRIEEGNAMAHFLLGKADNGQGNGLMCVAHLTKAIVLKDDFIEARLLRAEALIAMKQFKESLEDIETILQQNPEEETALLLRGQIQVINQKNEMAEKDFKHIIHLNPFNEQAFLHLGKLYILENRLKEAIDILNEAIEMNPHFAQAYHERGLAKLMTGDKEGSLEDITQAMQLNPKEVEKLSGQFNNQELTKQTDILGL